jgi:adenosine deaminase
MSRLLAAVIAALFLLAAAPAQTPAERATAARLAAIAHDPVALRAFFGAMPKGGDLHNHLDGAVDAERYVDWAAHDGLCYDPASLALSMPPCADGHVVRADDAALRTQLIDAFTMRDFVPSSGSSGHDHFFASFEKFGAAFDDQPEASLMNAARHAGDDRLDYVEFMVPVFDALPLFANALREVKDTDDDATLLRAVQPALAAAVRDERARIDVLERERAATCIVRSTDPACRPTVRFLIEVIRSLPYKDVVAQAALAFALAHADPQIVGVNFVAPEDDPATLSTYARQMHLVAALRDAAHPVHVSLHAGELTLGLVPREDLRDHIASAVNVAGAERIGHGVDIAYEDDAGQLLREMAALHILVEVGLSSNDLILGVRGPDHPLPTYLAAHVPVALITDDEGVSRIDLTNEFVRAERDYQLDYATIKTLVRNSLEYAFAPGASLWIDHDYARPVAACASLTDEPAPACAALLQANLKMRLQYHLERELRAFESGYGVAPLR